jgi:hypothetical protein
VGTNRFAGELTDLHAEIPALLGAERDAAWEEAKRLKAALRPSGQGTNDDAGRSSP